MQRICVVSELYMYGSLISKSLSPISHRLMKGNNLVNNTFLDSPWRSTLSKNLSLHQF